MIRWTGLVPWQDPVLIARTVREAIDPLDAYSTSSLEQV